MEGQTPPSSGGPIVRLVLASRWAMAPLLIGLIGALLVLVVFFLADLWTFAQGLAALSETQVILKVLSLMDLALIGGLLVIIIQSGYENFVGKIEARTSDAPKWMFSISFGGLKLKLFASLMAITAIALLKGIMKLELSVSEAQVKWLAVALAIFILAYAALAFTDRFTQHEWDGH